MSDVTAFAPLYLAAGPNTAGTLVPSVTLAVTTSSQAITLPPGNSFNQLLINNQAGGYIYINLPKSLKKTS